jgi:hypothetical protein
MRIDGRVDRSIGRSPLLCPLAAGLLITENSEEIELSLILE